MPRFIGPSTIEPPPDANFKGLSTWEAIKKLASIATQDPTGGMMMPGIMLPRAPGGASPSRLAQLIKYLRSAPQEELSRVFENLPGETLLRADKNPSRLFEKGFSGSGIYYGAHPDAEEAVDLLADKVGEGANVQAKKLPGASGFEYHYLPEAGVGETLQTKPNQALAKIKVDNKWLYRLLSLLGGSALMGEELSNRGEK